MYGLHLQGRKSLSGEPASSGGHATTPPRHIPEDNILHSHHCENLKSYIENTTFGKLDVSVLR
jgi:hypothetical protein